MRPELGASLPSGSGCLISFNKESENEDEAGIRSSIVQLDYGSGQEDDHDDDDNFEYKFTHEVNQAGNGKFS